MSSNNNIVLGEFWVDSDGEIFVDIDDPLQAMENLYRFQQIQDLQRKLQQANDQQAPPITPLNHRNRPRQARREEQRVLEFIPIKLQVLTEASESGTTV